MSRRSRDILATLIVSPMGGLSFLLAMVPTLATSALSYFLIAIVVLGIVLSVISIYRDGRSVPVALAISVGLALLTFAIVFGPIYYFMNQSFDPAILFGID